MTYKVGGITVIDTSGNVPWAQIAGKPVIPSVTDISLLYLHAAENKGNRLNMVGGIMDPFADQTDVDTVASTNEVFSAGHYTPYVTPAVDQVPLMTSAVNGSVVISSHSNLSAGAAEWHAFNDAGAYSYWHSANTGGVGWIKVDFGSSNLKAVYTYSLMASAANSNHPNYAPRNFTFEGSVNGVSWTVLDTNYGVTWGLGTTRLFTPAITGLYRYYRINISTTAASSYVAIAEISLNAAPITNPMLLVPNIFTASAIPTTARIGVQASGAFTINADLTAEVSRDGGTTWSTATLVLIDTLADGTKYYEDAAVSVAAQPSGTAMKYRIKTYNATSPTVSGVLLQWS